MQYFPLYLQFIKIRLQAMLEYRNAFIWGALAQAASYAAEFLLIWVMINKFKTIGTWKPYEVMFLYALNLCSYAMAGFFLFNPCVRLSSMVQTGEFDEVLTKPLNPFLYLICREFNYGYFSHLSLSIAVIAICIIKLEIVVTPINTLFLIMTLLSGTLIQGAAFILTSVPSFWIIQNNGLMGVFMWDLKNFINYPMSVYDRTIQVLLTLIIPYAFINFYPSQYFLNKNDFLFFHPVFQYLSPFVGIVLFLFAYRFWNIGIRNYQSTGS